MIEQEGEASIFDYRLLGQMSAHSILLIIILLVSFSLCQEISYFYVFSSRNYLLGTVSFVNILLAGETEAGNRGDEPARDNRLQWVV